MATKANETAAANVPANVPQIYALIGKAMKEIGAVGKDSINQTQGFRYRGIDAVMNALNPVMSKYGLFITTEVLEQTREERSTVKSVWDKDKKQYVEKTSTLIWSVLKIRFTMYAPDGSNISSVIIGEGMDTGDKATNKALSIALKYAAFQIFMIPTEETAVDPDAESHEVAPKIPAKTAANTAPVEVNKVSSVPAVPAPEKPQEPAKKTVLEYLAAEQEELRKRRGLEKPENAALWKAQIAALRDAGLISKNALSTFSQAEAENMVSLMYSRFDPTGTVLKNAGET